MNLDNAARPPCFPQGPADGAPNRGRLAKTTALGRVFIMLLMLTSRESWCMPSCSSCMLAGLKQPREIGGLSHAWSRSTLGGCISHLGPMAMCSRRAAWPTSSSTPCASQSDFCQHLPQAILARKGERRTPAKMTAPRICRKTARDIHCMINP